MLLCIKFKFTLVDNNELYQRIPCTLGVLFLPVLMRLHNKRSSEIKVLANYGNAALYYWLYTCMPRSTKWLLIQNLLKKHGKITFNDCFHILSLNKHTHGPGILLFYQREIPGHFGITCTLDHSWFALGHIWEPHMHKVSTGV